jgi:hypothetical protein
VGFNSEVFDVRDHESGEFMIRTLVLHREKKKIWNFINVYDAAQNENKKQIPLQTLFFLLKKSVPLANWGRF